jgi:hypothetical protein
MGVTARFVPQPAANTRQNPQTALFLCTAVQPTVVETTTAGQSAV